MKRNEILDKLNIIFRNELDNDKIELNEQTTADHVAEWDSLSHIQLTTTIEKTFKIRFSSLEIQKWDNVGQMMDSIEKRLKNV